MYLCTGEYWWQQFFNNPVHEYRTQTMTILYYHHLFHHLLSILYPAQEREVFVTFNSTWLLFSSKVCILLAFSRLIKNFRHQCSSIHRYTREFYTVYLNFERDHNIYTTNRNFEIMKRKGPKLMHEIERCLR